MPKKTYQLLIILLGIEPKIWRRILVFDDTPLVNFHRIVQTCFGWTNSHLHLFKDGVYQYSPREFEVEHALDSRDVRLNEILNRENQFIFYEYDFGDGWLHKILLELINEEDAYDQVPKCLKGERRGPPEDCGGIHGYYENLKIISDKKHEEYQSTKIWLGRGYNPEEIKIDKINKLLKRKDFGCEWIE